MHTVRHDDLVRHADHHHCCSAAIHTRALGVTNGGVLSTNSFSPSLLMHVMRTGYLEDAPSAWQPLLQHTSRRRPSSSCSTVCTWSSQREAIAHGSARRVPLGIPIESHRGYYTLLEKMYQKLVCNLEEVFGVVVLSPRECSKGKRSWLITHLACSELSFSFNLSTLSVTDRTIIGSGTRPSQPLTVCRTLRHLRSSTRQRWFQLGGVYLAYGSQHVARSLHTAGANGSNARHCGIAAHDTAISGEGCAHRESPDGILHYEGKR